MPIDQYSVHGGETSTIEYGYLRNHEKVKRWMNTLDEEHRSISSLSISNEQMLDYVTHGHSTKEHNAVYIHDSVFSDSTENYNASTTTKSDIGYYSSSSDRYISEDAAFCNKGSKATSSVLDQEKSHLDNVIEEEGHVQSASSQITLSSPILNGYTTIEQINIQHSIKAGDYKQEDDIPNTSEQYASSPFQISLEETNENSKSPVVSAEDYFPITTAEIHQASNSFTSPTITDEIGNSPAASEGEYLPYTFAMNQYDSVAEQTSTLLETADHHIQQNHATEVHNGVSNSGKPLQQETLDNSHMMQYITTEV